MPFSATNGTWGVQFHCYVGLFHQGHVPSYEAQNPMLIATKVGPTATPNPAFIWYVDDYTHEIPILYHIFLELSHAKSPDFPFPMVFSPFEPRNGAPEEPWLPGDLPRDVLWDGARVAALLDRATKWAAGRGLTRGSPWKTGWFLDDNPINYRYITYKPI